MPDWLIQTTAAELIVSPKESTMFNTLPTHAQDCLDWDWSQLEPYYTELTARPVESETVTAWLTDWTRLSALISEVAVRLRLQYDLNTADAEAERRLFRFLEALAPAIDRADHALDEKLLASGLEPEGLAIPLRNLRAEVALFREENLALLVEEQKTSSQYDKIVGAQTVEWEGADLPLPRLRPVLSEPDRTRREAAWRLSLARQLADREAINEVWRQLIPLRGRIAANADHPDFRSYIWPAYHRFDYTPDDCTLFHQAIEAVCVPAASRIYERHRQRLGVESLRPWDLTDGAWGRPAPSPGQLPLRPYETLDELLDKSQEIFTQLDPALAQEFQTLRTEGLLDIENRKGKAPGGYCTYLATQRRPFIFMNAVGLHRDVETLLHEAGHAFHAFAKSTLPYRQQLSVPMEFNEVASMSIELLAAPYLSHNGHGFYSPAEAAQARIHHLEEMILFWPYMAVVDAFQHWVYTHPDEAIEPAACDAEWLALSARFLPAVDWQGLESERATGWQRRLHIFRAPFYYIEYGLAALGAAQVWRNALADERTALRQYRAALALGGTAPLPQLFATAGARFAFDSDTMQEIVTLIETTIRRLEW
jgi:oligoendopeptidase F